MRHWLPITTLLLIIGGGVLAAAWMPLFDVDEGAFSEASREMLASGDWIAPQLDGQPRYDKPILTYWLQAGALALLGNNALAARLPSLFAAVLWLGVVFAFVRHHLGSSVAIRAILLMAGSTALLVMGRAATADALLNALMAACCLSLLHYRRCDHIGWLRLAWALAALGFLTKGPIALLVPFLVYLIDILCARHQRIEAIKRALSDRFSWLLFLLLALPWYGLMLQRDGMGFIQGFFIEHNLGRAQHAMEKHDGGWFYYLPVVLLWLFPFIGLLPGLLRQSLRERHHLLLPLWGWFIAILLLFTLVATKLPHYILYGITPLFILLAWQAEHTRSAVLWYAAFIALDLLVLALPWLPDGWVKMPIGLTDAWTWPHTLAALLALGLAMYGGLTHRQNTNTIRPLCLLGLANALLWLGCLLPVAGALQQEPVRQAALFARTLHEPIWQWRVHLPSFSFYRQQASHSHEQPPAGAVVLTRPDMQADWPDSQLLWRGTNVILIRSASVTSHTAQTR